VKTPTGAWIDANQKVLSQNQMEQLGNTTSIIRSCFERGGPSRYQEPEYIQEYFIEFPEDEEENRPKEEVKLDQINEKELIKTLKDRCTLKRERGDMNEVDEVEAELFKRKRQKKEEWFDDAGNLLLVTYSTLFGDTTYVVDKEGKLWPPSP